MLKEMLMNAGRFPGLAAENQNPLLDRGRAMVGRIAALPAPTG
jgi:hypothetical protein